MKRVIIMLLAMTAWSQPPSQPESEPVDEQLSPTTCVAICDHDLPVTVLKMDLDSDFYNTLNQHMTDYGFALIKNNENNVIYRNDEKLAQAEIPVHEISRKLLNLCHENIGSILDVLAPRARRTI